MANDIETLKMIKEEEEKSEKKLKKTESDAAKIVDDAKKDTQHMMERATREAADARSAIIERAKKDAGVQRQKIMFEATKKAKEIKPIGKETVFKIFQKALRERFGA